MERFDLTSADGTRLIATRWAPTTPAKADVLLVHGLGEHLGRYDHIASAFTAAGFRVTGVDLRGHGRSAGRRGHVGAWSDYLADVSAAAAAIGGPYALFGHSMGALVTLDYLRGHTAWAAYASAIPVDFAVAVPRWKLAASGVLSRWLPFVPLGNEIDADDIATDPQVIAKYKADPLVHGTVTPRWFTEFVAAGRRVREAAPTYRTPLFLSWGEQDALPSIPAMEQFFAAYGGEKHRRTWPGLKHEVHNEPSWPTLMTEVVAWFDARAPRSSA